MISRHYSEHRKFREDNIKKYFGTEGEIVYSAVKYNEKRKNYFLYEVTENAVLIVKTANGELTITKMLARPSRIKAVWDNPTEEVLQKARENSRNRERSR